MDQKGHIVEIIDKDTALFKMERLSACASCGKCIGSTTSESQEIMVEVVNNIGAKVGDTVEVNMDDMNVLGAIGIVYGIPLFSLIIGTVGSYFLLKNQLEKNILEILSFAIGIILTIISYIIIKSKDSKFRESRRYMPVVSRILIDLNAIK
ncbi:SoxR reducing system RseC family protein [Peptostreptococcus equinus]|uniref:SoxR reducing system RseC family protein n=1 Tax=Peptostreptococcus equinus TaxID=3003601 RepID=A0ABY7JSX3_9FIRM|nr:SoxR reducing system RseC family protein [Peptostreptococcus sp. CBA3647]WAW15571.1 SoxR reducing system RseC family protein [Peptostreptococcus sp. CBA3647]